MAAMDVHLVDVTHADLPLIDGWLSAEHVRRYWGDPKENKLLVRDPPPDTHLAIIQADGTKVGVVVWQHPTRQELDEVGLNDIPETVIDLDIMIGEFEEIGRGVGSAAMITKPASTNSRHLGSTAARVFCGD